MRQVLSVSLPGSTIQKIKQKTKQKGFSSVSDYIKYLLIQEEDLISENELAMTVKEARIEYKQSKTIKAKSMADLV